MNIHKENDLIAILTEDDIKGYHIQMDGSMKSVNTTFDFEFEYKAYDNFYIHSGQEEYISYMTVAPDGRLIEVNRFIALHKNLGIQRVDGTKG